MQELERPLAAITLAVVGAPFPNADGSNRKFEIMLCEPGETVELRPDPQNKRDPRAVAVFSCRGVQLGYLSAERCGRVGSLIRSGREVQAVFQAESHFGAWIRVAFDGERPAVTASRKPAPEDPEGGWFPDEIWPDD
jgi:hypothetical protein